MIRFRILFVFDALIAIVVLQQCMQLAPDLMPGRYYNAWPLMLTLLAALGVCGASLWGGFRLKTRGRTGLASLVLLIPAVPTVLLLLGLATIVTLFSINGGHH